MDVAPALKMRADRTDGVPVGPMKRADARQWKRRRGPGDPATPEFGPGEE
jgi:hypothetical protein